jgi:hypothetical protein
VIAVISVVSLIQQAAANGDAPVNGQGYHFKLQFSQDPQKHKTFWVHCTPPGTPGGPIPAPPPGSGGGNGGSGSTPGNSPGTTGNSPGTTGMTLSMTPGGVTSGTPQGSTHRHRGHGKRHTVRTPKRHHKPRRPVLHVLGGAGARFTG